MKTLLLIVAVIAAKPVEPAALSTPFMRSAEDPGHRIALEIVSRTYESEGRPTVTLVGVAHVAERELYENLQKVLDDHDVVLYESVKPPGTGGAGGKTPAARIESTEAAMAFTAAIAHAHRQRLGVWPESIDALAAFAGDRDSRLQQWVHTAQHDAWKGRIRYRTRDGGFELRSLGGDGKPGGEGEAADLAINEATAIDPSILGGDEDNIQAELAKALSLEFQLDGIDYDREHFRCSDMSMDQLQRAMQDEGLEFDLQGSVGGSGLLGRIGVFVLRLVRMMDYMLEGALADYGKVMLIELFADERVMELSLDQMGEGFKKVIVDDRNGVVLHDLEAILEDEPDVDSVAIFYGAAHMPDFAERLDGLGYRPLREQWFTAFEVNLDESVLDHRQLQQVRNMIKQQLRFMTRGR